MHLFRELTPRFGLRPLATAFLWVLAIAVATAAASFYSTHGEHGLSTPMILFLALVVVSRFGLYGFDLANIQLQQLHVDEIVRGALSPIPSPSSPSPSPSPPQPSLAVARQPRSLPLPGAVGSVESSLCSLGTASLFVGTLLVSSQPSGTHSFDDLVYLSACFVGSAALVYTVWVIAYHEHEHEHPLFEAHVSGHAHKHTTQQRRSLEASPSRTHIHLHFHPPFLTPLRQLRNALGRLGLHMGETESSSDHAHSHSHAEHSHDDGAHYHSHSHG